MLKLPQQIRPASIVGYFGLAIVHAWIYIFNTGGEAAPLELSSWQNIYVPIAFTMIALAIAENKISGIATSIPGCIIASASGIASAGMAMAFPNLASTSVISLLCGGVFVGWAYSAWAEAYAKLDITQATFFLFGSGILASVLKSLLYACPLNAVNACLALLAPLAMFTAAKSVAMPSNNRRSALRFGRHDIKSFWKVAAIIVVFSLVVANLLFDGDQSRASSNPAASFYLGRLCEIVLCACVLLWTFKLRKPFDFVQLWRIVLVISATDILLRIAIPDLWFQTFFSSICVNFIVLFVWLTLCDIAQHSDYGALNVFSIGWSLYTLPLFVGVTFAQLSNGHTTENMFLTVMLYAALIVSTFCLELRDRDMQLIFSDINSEAAPEPQDFADIDKRCAAIAETKHLTGRELEVMQMLCKGRTKAYIAESMFVTENTVKGHTKRLYTKLGVHSKKELQQLIDIE